MIKVIAPALVNPGTRSLAQFHTYWAESHGPLFSNTRQLWGYVQHLTLPESYDREPKPTHDGASIFWYEDLDALRYPTNTPEAVALREAVRADDRQLFDRLPGWPLSHKRASVTATERIVVDGETAPKMVKAIFIASRLPGLTLDEFFQHWYEVHGPLGAKLPGLRRYVQNHAIAEAHALRPMTHDGWSELWFDDLDALRRAHVSPEWQALSQDGQTLFARPMGVIIARERVQRWEGKSRTDLSGVASLDDEEIRTRLTRDGFITLAADPQIPSTLRSAAQASTLAVWTPEHIVTIDGSHIDARPERAAVAG